MTKSQQELTTLRQKDQKSLLKELSESRLALQKARVELAFGRLKKTSTINELKKKIARIETVSRTLEVTNA